SEVTLDARRRQRRPAWVSAHNCREVGATHQPPPCSGPQLSRSWGDTPACYPNFATTTRAAAAQGQRLRDRTSVRSSVESASSSIRTGSPCSSVKGTRQFGYS